MKHFIYYLVISCMSCFLFFSCYKKTEEKFKPIATIKISFEDNTFFTGFRMPDESLPRNYISKINNEIPYGGGLYFKIPDSLINKDIKILIKSKLRTNERFTYGHLFAITLNTADQQLFWSQIDLDPFIKNKNTWNAFSDSTLIPSAINNRTGTEIRVFGFNASKKCFMEYDDLEVNFLVNCNNQ